jgi:hypothetical protein
MLKQPLWFLRSMPYIPVTETDENGAPSEWASPHHRGIYVVLALWMVCFCFLYFLHLSHLLFFFFDVLQFRPTEFGMIWGGTLKHVTRIVALKLWHCKRTFKFLLLINHLFNHRQYQPCLAKSSTLMEMKMNQSPHLLDRKQSKNGIKSLSSMKMKKILRPRRLHRKQPKNPGLVVLLNVLHQPNSKPCASFFNCVSCVLTDITSTRIIWSCFK